MSAASSLAIPYEKQADLQTSRMCGAAALSMVYRSLGKTISQAELWPKIAKHSQAGGRAAATHLMAQDALNRGFAALAIQAKHPLQALRACQEHGIRAILNHRLKEDAATGHFSVLVAIDSEHVVLHDPYYGPSRRLLHMELLELWRPRYLNAEILGNVLIGIAAPAAGPAACPDCHTAFPPHIDCPRCGKPVLLQPAALLGCLGAGCAARLWNYLCCPYCEYLWTFNLEAPSARVPAETEKDLWNINQLSGEIDRFCDRLLRSPAVGDHPDLAKQIDFIKANKEKLKLAQSEELARRKTRAAQLAQVRQKVKQQEEAILKKQEEINTPAAPLDGNALGEALLKELGLLTPAATPQRPPQPAPGRKPTPRIRQSAEQKPFDPHGTWHPGV